jgi:hypothetical protein
MDARKDEQMKTAIATFYYEDLHPTFAQLHRKVVEKLMPENCLYFQIKTNSHGNAMTRFAKSMCLQSFDLQVDKIIFLDIDCIPLCREALTEPFQRNSFWGCAQRANHIENGEHIYASPFALGIMLNTYQHLNQPDFNATNRGDVGEELTYVFEQVHGQLKPLFLQPSHVEAEPPNGYWKLKGDAYFGYGTTYSHNDKPYFYHSFESRSGGVKRFEAKCKEVLK